MTKLEDFVNRTQIEGNESGMHQNILQRIGMMKQVVFQKLQQEQQAQQAAQLAQQQADNIPGDKAPDDKTH